MTLALATNVAAVQALRMAIRALEDDSAALTYLAEHNVGGGHAEDRLREAREAVDAAAHLRQMVATATRRLEALSAAQGTKLQR